MFPIHDELLTFAARFTSARGGLPVLALVELGCFELDVEVGCVLAYGL